MRLTVDSAQMRACIGLWREMLLAPHHSGAHPQESGRARDAQLARVAATMTGWVDLLGLCQPQPGEESAFRELKLEVQRFKTWVEDAQLAVQLARYGELLEAQELARSRPSAR